MAPGILLPLWTTAGYRRGLARLVLLSKVVSAACFPKWVLTLNPSLRSFHLLALHSQSVIRAIWKERTGQAGQAVSHLPISQHAPQEKTRSQERASWTNVLKKRIHISQISVFCDESCTSPPKAPGNLLKPPRRTCCRGVPIVGLGSVRPVPPTTCSGFALRLLVSLFFFHLVRTLAGQCHRENMLTFWDFIQTLAP